MLPSWWKTPASMLTNLNTYNDFDATFDKSKETLRLALNQIRNIYFPAYCSHGQVQAVFCLHGFLNNTDACSLVFSFLFLLKSNHNAEPVESEGRGRDALDKYCVL